MVLMIFEYKTGKKLNVNLVLENNHFCFVYTKNLEPKMTMFILNNENYK